MPLRKASNDFLKHLKTLPDAAKKKLVKVLILLLNDPKHPSLNLKKMQATQSSEIYECRLDDFWRLILKRIDDMNFDLIYVAQHDKALRYGESILCEAGTAYDKFKSDDERLQRYLSGDENVFSFSSLPDRELDNILDGIFME